MYMNLRLRSNFFIPSIDFHSVQLRADQVIKLPWRSNISWKVHISLYHHNIYTQNKSKMDFKKFCFKDTQRSSRYSMPLMANSPHMLDHLLQKYFKSLMPICNLALFFLIQTLLRLAYIRPVELGGIWGLSIENVGVFWVII